MSFPCIGSCRPVETAGVLSISLICALSNAQSQYGALGCSGHGVRLLGCC